MNLWWFDGRHIKGLSLRYLLALHLSDVGRACATRELVEAVRAAGFEVPGRPSKTVSDALRWEVRRGRVTRCGRGVYAPGTIAPETKRRMRRQITRLRAHVVARM
jgi:hypothetical protein